MAGSGFSLVLATVDRTHEIERLLASLCAQAYRPFELIVVDQNADDRLERIVRAWQDRVPIRHIRADRGLSRARNAGLRCIRYGIVAFPDDDCWYPQDLLARVARFFDDHPATGGLTGRSVDERGASSMGHWNRREGALTRYNLWWRAVSITLFLRRAVVDRIGEFDERLGAGAWGTGEETDYLVRALDRGFPIRYVPDLTVFHAQSIQVRDPSARAPAYRDGLGWGWILHKHRYPVWFAAYHALRPLGGGILALLKGQPRKSVQHWDMVRGRLAGWMGAGPP